MSLFDGYEVTPACSHLRSAAILAFASSGSQAARLSRPATKLKLAWHPLREEHDMKMRTTVVAAALALASATAFAFHCPVDMKAIDDALPSAKLDAKQTAEVKKLRAEGETLHKAGKHQESMDTLAKAKKILAI
jgi:hypothetical protein